MRILTAPDFVEMEWKNKQGLTTELIKEEDFSTRFRLSIAAVTQDGAFSQFVNTDRHLIILEGEGCSLNFENQSILLTKESDPYLFNGEDKVSCKLLAGKIIDFNVMVRRSDTKAKVQRIIDKTIVATAHRTMIYIKNKHELILLNLGEIYEIDQSEHVLIEIYFKE